VIDKELLDILACPACNGDVELSGNEVICKACLKRYPVINGIPVLLIEEGEKANG